MLLLCKPRRTSSVSTGPQCRSVFCLFLPTVLLLCWVAQLGTAHVVDAMVAPGVRGNEIASCPTVCSSAVCDAPNQTSLPENIDWLLSRSRYVREFSSITTPNVSELPNCSLASWGQVYYGVQTRSVALVARAFASSGDTWTARSLVRSVTVSPTSNTYGTSQGTFLCAVQGNRSGYEYRNASALEPGACFNFEWVASQAELVVGDGASVPFAQGAPQLGITVMVGIATLAVDAAKGGAAGCTSCTMLTQLMPALTRMQFQNVYVEAPRLLTTSSSGGNAIVVDDDTTGGSDVAPTFHPAPIARTMSATLPEPPPTNETNTTTSTTMTTSTANTTTTPMTTATPTTSTSTTTTTATVVPSTAPNTTTPVLPTPSSSSSSSSTTSAPTMASTTATTRVPATTTTTSTVAPTTDSTSSHAPATATTAAPVTTTVAPATPAPMAPTPYVARFDTQLQLFAWARGIEAFNVAIPNTVDAVALEYAGQLFNTTSAAMQEWLCASPTISNGQRGSIVARPYIPLSIDVESWAYNTTLDPWVQCSGLAASVVAVDDWCSKSGLAFSLLANVVRSFGVGYPLHLDGISATAGGGDVDVELTAMCLVAAQTLQAAYLPAYLDTLSFIITSLSSVQSPLASQDCHTQSEGVGADPAAAFSFEAPSVACGGPMPSFGLTALRWMALSNVNPFDISTLLPSASPNPAPSGSPAAGAGPSATLNVAVGGAVGAVVLIVGGAIILRRVRHNPNQEALLQAPTDNLGFY